MRPPCYDATGSGRSIKCLSRSGDRVLLDDRSLWALDPVDAPRLRRWSRWTPLTVLPAGPDAYWLVARRDEHEERILVGFGGYFSDRPVPVALAS